MPLNVPGIVAPFQLLVSPRFILPALVVKGLAFLSSTVSSMLADLACYEDIRQLDFAALYKAGYRGAVFDKDNCLVSG